MASAPLPASSPALSFQMPKKGRKEAAQVEKDGKNEKPKWTRPGEATDKRITASCIWGTHMKGFLKAKVLVMEEQGLISVDGWIPNTVPVDLLPIGESSLRCIDEHNTKVNKSSV
jgi:hypothetical protein